MEVYDIFFVCLPDSHYVSLNVLEHSKPLEIHLLLSSARIKDVYHHTFLNLYLWKVYNLCSFFRSPLLFSLSHT